MNSESSEKLLQSLLRGKPLPTDAWMRLRSPMRSELHRPTNLVGWLSAMGSLCVILAGFVLLVNEPLQIAIARNHDDIVRTEESADSSSERIARNEGRLEVLEEVVKDIDKYGSRRWNERYGND